VTAPTNWEDEGRRVGPPVDAYHAIVVVGADPIATAQVALGIGRAATAVARARR